MASLLHPHPLIFLCLISSALSPLPSISTTPLAHRCGAHTPTIQPNTTNTLLQELTAKALSVGPANMSMFRIEQELFHGLAQCRWDLSLRACNSCLQSAKDMILVLCPTSDAAVAWFDGCYIDYYYYQHQRTSNSTSEFQMQKLWFNHRYVKDQAHFKYALDALLLRLVADIHQPYHRGFSSGATQYDAKQHRVYALAECLQLVPLEKCAECVTKAVHEVYECCSVREGATVLARNCFVRFESYRFFSSVGRGERRSDSDGHATSFNETLSDDCRGIKVKVVLWAWGVGFACFVGSILCALLLRRKIISTKVGAFREEVGEDKL